MIATNRHNLSQSLRPPLLALLAISLWPMSLWAASADRQLPLEVEADRKHTDYKGGQAVYEGQVVIRQGRMLIHADKATLTLRDNQLDRAQLIGKPVTYQDVDEQGLPLSGQALNMDYKVDNTAMGKTTGDILTLTGQAKIERNKDTLSSERITYNLKSEVMDAGGGQGDRVHMILQPRPKDGAGKDGTGKKESGTDMKAP
ncbi:MAG: lipopolysaccharide transport periplasmic protein LptA [Halothiobacillaceae bacterium]|nr:lipopolysaccharide transport periplasmic protein LptA [Halothiobacillaceae bacterium]